jgi:hypothetical protein
MPGPFRFGEPDSLPSEMRAAGFADVAQTAESVEWLWPGPVDEYLNFLVGTLPPVRRAIETPRGEQVRSDIRDVIASHEREGGIHYDVHVFVVTGRKPA